MRVLCTWQQGLRSLGALLLAVVGLDLRYGLGVTALGGPLRFTLSSGPALVSEGSTLVLEGSAPASAGSPAPTPEYLVWQHREASCRSFEQQLRDLGDLTGESPTELASARRVLSLVELKDLRRQVRSGSRGLVQDRRAAVADAARCGVIPVPSWTLDLNKTDIFAETLHYRDTASRYKVAVDADMRPQPTGTLQQSPAVALPPGPLREDVFAALRNRWVYFHGDSTLRQVCCELVKLLADIVYSFKEFKNLVRHKIDEFGIPFRNAKELSACIVQQPLQWEREPGRCENTTGCECDPFVGCSGGPCPRQACDPARAGNEVTYTWYFSKFNLTLTFDWKANALQRYDRWLLQRRFSKRAPDIYISSAGMHDCFWPVTRMLGQQHHREQLAALFDYMAAFLPNTTRVIWLPGQISRGRRLAKGYDECLRAVNGAAKEEAATRGFTFIDRERILRSLLDYAEEHVVLLEWLDLDGVHFLDYVQLIIRQYLLSTFLCLLHP